MHLTRRSILTAGLLTAAAAGLPDVWSRPAAATAAPGESRYLKLIKNGLPRATEPKRVVIVGAGIAGLVAAYELQRAGHEVTIVEARNRIGGRIYTMRAPFADGLHAEAGAMRVPRAHKLTMAYIEKFGLQTYPFTPSDPDAFIYVRGHRYRKKSFNPSDAGFDIRRGKKLDELVDEALSPLRKQVSEEGAAGWRKILREYDSYSIRDFFESRGFRQDELELYGLLYNTESIMNSAFVEELRNEIEHGYTNLVQLTGGTDRLTDAFLPAIGDRIRLQTRMRALSQDAAGVAVHCSGPAGDQTITADHAIVTVPFPVLRHIEVHPVFSPAKQRAIRQLNYGRSGKIFLQCSRRFWEADDRIFGGGSVADLPVRNVYYPEHGRETGKGVLVASYTWDGDASAWQAMPEAERLAQTVENVALIHPQIKQHFELGVTHFWDEDEFAGGAFALFDPYQESELHEAVIAPEGRVHFAGDHAALEHAWIQGAVHSAIRAALEVTTGGPTLA